MGEPACSSISSPAHDDDSRPPPVSALSPALLTPSTSAASCLPLVPHTQTLLSPLSERSLDFSPSIEPLHVCEFLGSNLPQTTQSPQRRPATLSSEDCAVQLLDPLDLSSSSSSPSHLLLQQMAASRKSRTMRLPSFDLLGIAAPYSNHIPQQPPLDSMGEHGSCFVDEQDVGALGESAPSLHPSTGSLSLLNPSSAAALSRDPFSAHRHSPALLTPPLDHAAPSWALSNDSNAPFEKSLAPITPSPEQSAPRSLMSKANISQDGASSEREGNTTWLELVMEVIASSVDSRQGLGSSVQVLSHALPSPAIPGHYFPYMINALRERIPPSPLVWISLLHAVPGRFNLADLPTSPPSTPGMAIGGDDYFTTRVFDSAVPACDYDQGVTVGRRPQPVAAPCSVDLSIVERYIPPTNSNEFAELFNPVGSSLLVDRLVELSPDNGCLVFIYPTRAGAKTFMNHYLGPVLDPLLRGIAVVHGLSSDLSTKIGQMAAVDNLHDFDFMRQRIAWLCAELSRDGHSPHGFYSAPSKYTVEHAAKQEVVPEGNAWAKWWMKQEKPRVRATVQNYFGAGSNSQASDADLPELVPTNIIHEIFDGVSARSKTMVPAAKLEMGIFVIKRAQPRP